MGAYGLGPALRFAENNGNISESLRLPGNVRQPLLT